MTDIQFEYGDEHISTAKYDDDFSFLPYSSGYRRSYLLGRFKMGGEVLNQLGLGVIFVRHGADGYFVLYDSHEY